MSSLQNLTICGLQHEPNDMLCVEFAETNLPFVQGQYLTLIADIDGEEIRRSYSICNAVGEPVKVAIKRIEGGRFSQYAHEEFGVGTQIRSLPPAGDFHSVIHAQNKKHYLCIAAGSGITPVLSIIKTVFKDEPDSRVTLIYGNRRSADIAFRDELLWLKSRHMERFHWINIFSQEKQGAAVLNGRIDNKKGQELNQRLIDLEGFDEFFLCGPEGMTSGVSRGLRDLGIDEGKIHYELFFASAEDARLALAKHKARALQYAGLNTALTVRHLGREVSFELPADGENILDSAMSNGLDLPFACKGGVCATCKARVVEGEVDMDLNHALSEKEIAGGYVLTCQAHPVSDRVVIDFDVT